MQVSATQTSGPRSAGRIVLIVAGAIVLVSGGAMIFGSARRPASAAAAAKAPPLTAEGALS